MKILYCICEKVTLDTKLSKGTINESSAVPTISGNNETILLDCMEYADIKKMPGGGTMIKIINRGQTVFIDVPRIYIDKGSGFVVSNYFKTKKLCKLLQNKILKK